MDAITLSAYAKINLTLDVTGRRPDGYHTVRMVMQSVGLHDDVTVTRTGTGGVTLACDKPFVPTDGRNLAVRAAEHFFACTGLACDGLHIALKKRIPVAAGLAGGSTDAAAVLRALDTLYGAGLSTDALCGMGLALGADVPYCLVGGTMLAEGIGEELTALAPMPHCWVVLCKPPFAVSTKDVYREMDAVDIKKRPDTAGMVKALEKGDYNGVCKRLSNVMELVTATKRRQIGEIKAFLAENGADGTLMSGSGPTVFGLFSDEGRARTAAKMLSRRFADTFLTETV